MKHLFLALGFIAALAVPASAQNGGGARFQFADKGDAYNFGTVPQGVPAVHVFQFKNTGNAPLVITNAEASCGCTKPEFSSKPVPPGGTGEIRVTYNAASVGAFDKPVYITTNAAKPDGKEKYELHITGTVAPPKG